MLCFACQPSIQQEGYVKFSGPTMGTAYNITCGPTADTSLRGQVDQLLVELNQELSTYIKSSTISRFNQENRPISLKASKFFKDNLIESQKIYEASKGYFDPTVMPLVNYWGFGYKEKRAVQQVDSTKVDSLLRFVGFEKLDWQDGNLKKLVPNLQLDFSALAKGYAVDEIGRFLASKNVSNFLVEIGGEVVTKGKNPLGQIWTLGINVPKKDAALNEMALAIELNNRGMATSGNYRIFYQGDGYEYAHTINPITGFPEKSNLLSATVVADNCMKADGYATAFMSLGLEKAFPLAMKIDGLEAVFLYTNDKGELQEMATPAIQKMIKR